MIVPHQGQSVFRLRIPIQFVKYAAVAFGVFLVLFIGAFINYRYTMNTASVEKMELADLRQTNGKQLKQLEQIARETALLQEDMNRLNQLDNEIRRMVNSEEVSATSRSGTVRPNLAFNGQGGSGVKPTADEIANLVRELQETAQARQQSLTSLRAQLTDRKARIAATPSIWPASGDVTSRFGWRSSPWGWGSDWHPGIDIANDYGTPVAAAADGRVSFAGWYSGYGNLIHIDHGNGIVTLYGHNASILVSVGQQVHKGDIIAKMGSTGASTGPHVHYEVQVNGTAVNPASFL